MPWPIEYGNLSINPETSHKFLLVIKTKPNYNWSSSLLFQNFNYIFIEPTGLKQTIRGAFPVWTYKSTTFFDRY